MDSPSEPVVADKSILGTLPIPVLHHILHGCQQSVAYSIHGVRLSCKLLQREHDVSARKITLREDHLLHGTAGLRMMPHEALLGLLLRLGSVESLTLIRGKGRIFSHDGLDTSVRRSGLRGLLSLPGVFGTLQEAGAVLKSIESDIPLSTSDLEFIRDYCGWNRLQKLSLVDSGGGCSYAPGIPLMIVQSVEGLIRLQHLCLRGIALAQEGARRLAEQLKTMADMSHLDLGSCSLGSYGAIAVCSALPCISRLTHLDFSNNSIGVAGAHSLAPCLKLLLELQHLSLDGNSLSEGISALALGLGHLHRLRQGMFFVLHNC